MLRTKPRHGQLLQKKKLSQMIDRHYPEKIGIARIEKNFIINPRGTFIESHTSEEFLHRHEHKGPLRNFTHKTFPSKFSDNVRTEVYALCSAK